MDSSSNKKMKLSAKHEKDMKLFSGPVVYNESLKHINPQDPVAFDWEKFHKETKIVHKPAGTPVSYTPSAEALAIAAAEKERVAKRTAEETFDKVFTFKKSIRELDGIFNFLNLLFLLVY